MTFKSSVLVPDALVAMESNLKAILAMFRVRVKSLDCRIDPNSGTASIQHYNHGDGLRATVFFPALKSTQRLSKIELDRWTGYFIHEICHAIWTDEASWMKACKAGLNALVNGMEDVRIEREMVKSARVDNAKERLVELLEWVANRETPKDALPYDPNDPRSLPWTLAIIGRVKLGGYPIKAGHAAYAKLNPFMRALVDRALASLDKAKNTEDVLAIAQDIQARLAQNKPQAPDIRQAGPDKGDGDGDGEAEKGKGMGEASKARDETQEDSEGVHEASKGQQTAFDKNETEENVSDQPENGEGETSNASASENESESESGSGANGAGKPKPFDARSMDQVDLNPLSPDIAKASKATVKDREAGKEAAMASILKDAISRADKPLSVGETGYRGDGMFKRLAAEAQKASRLRQQCARVLRKSDRDSWQRRLSAGRIDRRAIGRLASGDHSNPYARHTFSPGYETEITIILDGSDSMNMGRKLERATSLALVVAQAAEQVGVKCEIVRFYRSNVWTLKAPRERVQSPQVQARLGLAAQTTSGSTPLTQSIALCAKRLATRAPTKRKMIFAVTDGICDMGRFGVRSIADHCDAAGVEVIGLSIDSTMSGAFRHEAEVDSNEDVAKAGLGVLVKALEAKAGR